MRLPIPNLPKIIEGLCVDGVLQFIVLEYGDFIQFAAAVTANHTPDVVTVLDVAGEHAFVVVSYEGLLQALLSIEITGYIDEQAYLERHKDVAHAVAQGQLRCGAEHYIFQGYFERRMTRFVDADRTKQGALVI